MTGHGVKLNDPGPATGKYQAWIDEIVRSPNQKALKSDFALLRKGRNMMQALARDMRQSGNVRNAIIVERAAARYMNEVNRSQAMGKALTKQYKAAKASLAAEMLVRNRGGSSGKKS